jgi:hypothetical protein
VAALCSAVTGCLWCCGEARAGINYTCDPSIEADDAVKSAFLNTALAGLYKSTLTDAIANIYITAGTTREL